MGDEDGEPDRTAASVMRLPTNFHPTHQTAGFNGFPAVDVFARAGTPVGSPATGRVVKLSGHPPTPEATPGGPYGWSIYLQGRAGTYYLTHLGTVAPIDSEYSAGNRPGGGSVSVTRASGPIAWLF